MVNRNEVEIKITVDERDATKGFKKTRIEAGKTKDAVNGASKSFGGMKVAALAAGAAMIGLGVGFGRLAMSAISAASDLQESINAVGVVFGDAADQITGFGATAAKEVGLANAEFNSLATMTGAMLKNVGFSQERMASETIRLTKRAADMASVFNTDVVDALSAINAALRGEIDPIEKFGVSMNAATIEAKALELGLAATKSEISATDKQIARLSVIMEQTAIVEGDFANTSDEFANATRVLKSDLTDLSASLGAKLIPAAEDTLAVIGPLVAQFKEWSDAGTSLDDMILDVAAANEELLPVLSAVSLAFKTTSDAWDGLVDAWDKTQDFKTAFENNAFVKFVNESPPEFLAFEGFAGDNMRDKLALREAKRQFDLVQDINQAREAVANFPGSDRTAALFDPLASIAGHTSDPGGVLAHKLRAQVLALGKIKNAMADNIPVTNEFTDAIIAASEGGDRLRTRFNAGTLELFTTNMDIAAISADAIAAGIKEQELAKEAIADAAKKLRVIEATNIAADIQFDLLMESRAAEKAVADEAARMLQIKTETLEMERHILAARQAAAVATSTRSADFIAASAGLGPAGGGGISGIRQQQAIESSIDGAAMAVLAKAIADGLIESAKAVGGGEYSIDGANVFIDGAQVNSMLGQSAEDAN